MADNNSTDTTIIGAGVGGKIPDGSGSPAPTKVAGGIAGSGLGALGEANRRKRKAAEDAAKVAGQQAGLAAVATPKPSPSPGQ